MAKGETPYSLNFGATYNDPTGPWLKVARDAVFGTERRRGSCSPSGKEPTLGRSLAPASDRHRTAASCRTHGAAGPTRRQARGRRGRPVAGALADAEGASATRRRPRSSSRSSSWCRWCWSFWMSVQPLAAARARRRSTPPTTTPKIPDNQLFAGRGLVHAEVHGRSSPSCCRRVALGLALLVQHRRRGVGFFRTAFFLPGAVGFAAASLLFYGFYSDERAARRPAAEPRASSTSRSTGCGTPNAALFSTIVDGALALRRLQHADPADRAAGDPDRRLRGGARRTAPAAWQTFRHITLPLLRPTIALMLVLSITGSLLAFDQFFILTRGGPDNSTVEHGHGDLPRGVHALRPRLGGGDLGACCWSCSSCFNVLQLRRAAAQGATDEAVHDRSGRLLRDRRPRSRSCSCSRCCGAAARRSRASRAPSRRAASGSGTTTAMARYGEGLATYLSTPRSCRGLTVARHAGRRRRSAATRSRASASPARTCCSWRRWRS